MTSSSGHRYRACEAFFRLALHWCGDATRAIELTEAALTAVGRERDPDHWAADLFRAGRPVLLAVPPVASNDRGLQAALSLSEPGRSALLMHASGTLSDGAMEHVLGLRPKPFAEALNTALAAVAEQTGSSPGEAERHLDEAFWKGTIPEEIRSRLNEIGAKAEELNNLPPWFCQPAVLAVAIGFIMILFVIGWMLAGSDAFPGSDKVEEIAAVPQLAAKGEFEPVDSPAGDLGDWFSMKGFPRYRVASGFESANAVGVRLSRMEGMPVAVVAVPLKGQNAFFYVFEAEPLGIKVGHPGHWEIIETRKNVLAVEEREGVCFMIVMPGGREDMEAILENPSNG